MKPTSKLTFWTDPAGLNTLAELSADPSGLSQVEAQQKLMDHGPNRVTDRAHHSLVHQVLRRLADPLVAVLMIAAAFSGLTGDRASFFIIASIVGLSVTLSLVQERHATHIAEALRKSIAIHVKVKRDGKLQSIDAELVVPGDLVVLVPGDLVPADGLFVSGNAARTNEALVTGEPYPVEKRRGPSNARNAADAFDAFFGGTALVSGGATMLVTATGHNTVLGGIAKTLQLAEPPTAFERGLRQLGGLIVRLTVFLVCFVLLVQLEFHRPAFESFMFAIALAVGLTPELLPMVTTVTLSRGALRMAKRKVIVKRLSAIHDLGSMDVLCTDKTGTLTEAKIVLASSLDASATENTMVLALAALDAGEAASGNPLDAAIQRAAAKTDLSSWNITGSIPFDFERRRASVVVEHAGRRLLITKGAPESVLQLSTATGTPGSPTTAMDSAMRQSIDVLQDSNAKAGYRMLAIAWRELEGSAEPSAADECELVFAGLCLFADPPKISAGAAIMRLQRANVKVKIVSGDAAATVEHLVSALAVQAHGLLTGEQIAEMNDHELAEAVNRHDLFARTSPDQKVRIVRALSAAGHVVGFLGDGINDAPAIKAADAGLSVQDATDVAREAADFILLDSDLNVVADGIEEGRRIYVNIMKYLRMGTSSNFGNMLSMALASVAIPFLPMTAIQILLNNIIYDFSQSGIPFDRVDAAEVTEPHRWSMKAILRLTLIMGPLSSVFDAVTFAVLILVYKASAAEFRTAWFVESMITQILVVFIIRTRALPWTSRPHPALVVTTLGALAAALFCALGPFSAIFGFTILPNPLLAWITGLALAYLICAEMTKRLAFRD